MQDNRTGLLEIFNNENDLNKVMSKRIEMEGPFFQQVKTPLTPLQIKNKKIGRNDPCGCNSGEKFKNCCWTGRKLDESQSIQ